MKNIKKIALLLLFISGSVFVSCTADNDMLTGGAKLGGLLSLKKESITYVVGDGQAKDYSNMITIFQGPEKVVKIEVYKTFTTLKLDPITGEPVIDPDTKKVIEIVSNQVLFKTFTPPATAQTEFINYSINYNELVDGLSINGAPVSTVDNALRIGDYFRLVYKSTLQNGEIRENSAKTKISIGTRFAGTYKVVQSLYWRINTLRTDIVWTGQTRTIESVDATTYRFVEFCGPFGPPSFADNSHYFTIQGDGIVRTPVLYKGLAQMLNGLPVINCEETPANMTNACSFDGPQNTVVKDDVNGKDRIYRSYGYLNTTGSREFYEVLEKVVE